MNSLQIAAFTLSIIGAFIAIFCYLPGAIKTLKYNDTRGISAIMFGLTVIGCSIWVVYSVLMLVNAGITHGDWSAFVGGFASLISNLGLGLFGAIIFSKKIINLKRAKKEGLTENEWYKKHYENVHSKKTN